MLSKEPQDRPHTAQELVELLKTKPKPKKPEPKPVPDKGEQQVIEKSKKLELVKDEDTKQTADGRRLTQKKHSKGLWITMIIVILTIISVVVLINRQDNRSGISQKTSQSVLRLSKDKISKQLQSQTESKIT